MPIPSGGMEGISHQWNTRKRAFGGHFPNLFYNYCSLQRPYKASAEEMTKYHSDDYIKFLRSIRPDNMSEYSKQMQRCKPSTVVFLMFTVAFEE